MLTLSPKTDLQYSTIKKQRFTQQLTVTRFFAAIMVVILHFGIEHKPFNWSYWAFIFESGRVFVSYFFVLSGFVLVVAYSSRPLKIWPYYANRLARIYPAYALGLILLIIVYFLTSRQIFWFELLLQSAMLHAWLPPFSLTFNYVAWSITVEVFFYILLPFVLPHTHRRYFLWVVCFIWGTTQVITFAARNDWMNLSSEFISFHPLMHLNEFLVGIFCAKVYLDKPTEKKRALQIIGVVILIILLLYFRVPFFGYRNGFLAPVFALSIYLLANDTSLRTLFSQKIGVFLGEISYGIYIFQVPIYKLMQYYLGANVPFLVFLLNLILVSAISYVLVEKPIKRTISSRFQNKTIPLKNM